MSSEYDEHQKTTPAYSGDDFFDRQHPHRLQMQSRHLQPCAVPGDFDEVYGPAHRFEPLPESGKLRLLAHMAGMPPTREVLEILREQTELALIALRKPAGRRQVLIDQLQVCEAAIRWLMHEANKNTCMAPKLMNAALAVQANLARLVVLLDQTEGRALSTAFDDVPAIEGRGVSDE